MKNFRIFVAILILGNALMPALSLGDDVPARDSAGAEEQRYREEQRGEFFTRDARKQIPDFNVPVDPDDSDPSVPDTQGITFDVREIRFSGNEKVTTVELQTLTQDFINRKVGMNELKKLASAVKQYYRAQGYIAAYAYIPAQDVTGGVVTVQIVEGKIGHVIVKGNNWYSRDAIKRKLGVRENSVLALKDLRYGLIGLNAHRDIEAKSSLRPGVEAGTTDLEIEIHDKFPFHIDTDVNNLGTKDTGIHRWGLSATYSNLLGFMDSLVGRVQLGSGAVVGGVSYTVPVGYLGTTLGANYTYSHVDLGNELGALDVRGTSHTYGFDIDQPFLKQNFEDLFIEASANVGFDFKSIENKILDRKAGVDELRILNLGINPELTGRISKTYFPHSFHIGFPNFLGASDPKDSGASRTSTGGQFFAYRGGLAHYTNLPHGLMHVIRGGWQLTNDRLAASEQFHLGGAYSIRGYREGEYLADYGGFLSNEILIPSLFFPEDWQLPFSSEPLRKQIQGVGFFDFGGGAIRKPLTGEFRERALSGAGGGVRVHLFDRVYGRLQWAARTGESASTGDDSAFHYGVSAELL